MTLLIKIALALLCFLCLADMPYGYYQFVRFAGLIGFSVLAYHAKQNKNEVESIVFVCLALLFQPFIKVALGREVWNIVDVLVGVGLILSIFMNKEYKKKEEGQ